MGRTVSILFLAKMMKKGEKTRKNVIFPKVPKWAKTRFSGQMCF